MVYNKYIFGFCPVSSTDASNFLRGERAQGVYYASEVALGPPLGLQRVGKELVARGTNTGSEGWDVTSHLLISGKGRKEVESITSGQ